MTTRIVAVALVGLLWAALPAAVRGEPVPNIVVILTDDQRWDTLWAMQAVTELASNGLTFTQAHTPTAQCCPSRASLLTGLYTHGHGVWGNKAPRGGFHLFDDGDTMATRLDAVGYRTAYFGKYLNEYDGSRIPPGWDRWFALVTPVSSGAYYDYDVRDDGSLVHHGREPSDYSTDVVAGEAEEFVLGAPPEDPLFMVVAPAAPHVPAVPAPRHDGAFAGLPAWRPPAFDEVDVSDKPRWVQEQGGVPNGIDRFRRRQYESLLAVDEMVERIVDALRQTDRLGTTMIAFVSDNGMQWGEHRLTGKNTAYEAATHVPLVVRFDGVVDEGGRDERLVAANVDVTATVLEAAGADVTGIDGVSLFGAERIAIPLEAIRTNIYGVGPRPAYCGARTEGRLYVRYESGFDELYVSARDPFELENEANTIGTKVLHRMRRLATSLCGGRVPGLRP